MKPTEKQGNFNFTGFYRHFTFIKAMEALSFKAFLFIDSRGKKESVLFSPQLEAFFKKLNLTRGPEERREDDGGCL